MAKKQTFEDKVNKKTSKAGSVRIKVIHAIDSGNSGNLKFREKMYAVPKGMNPDQFAKELLSKK